MNDVHKRKIKYNAEFNKKNYKQLTLHIKPDEVEFIKKIAANAHLSMTQLVLKSVKYCVNNNVNLNKIDDK